MNYESKLANMLQYGNGPGLAQLASSSMERPYSIDEIAKIQAEKRAHEGEYKRKAIACAIIGIAETLVVMHNEPVEDAFETAKKLANASQDFLTNFKLPENG